MTCKELMTKNPAYCLPEDSVAEAAQVMESEDVGPVLVVSDDDDRVPVGILTDRDVAIKVVANGRDPRLTRVGEVMTRDLVTCRIDDDAEDAIEAMGKHQVRRIPVVDQDGRLAGIIAQADVARYASNKETGDLVEDISAGGAVNFRGGRQVRRAVSSGIDWTTTTALGLAVGAGLMYLLDPERGRARRSMVKDKAASAGSQAKRYAGRVSRDLSNRAQGMMSEARHHSENAHIPDDQLVARVRTKMGRVVSHPKAIIVTAMNGEVTVRGPIFADEEERLIEMLNKLNGVHGVRNELEAHHDEHGHPSLQGGRRQFAAQGSEQHGYGLQDDWSPAMRAAAGLLGGGLVLYGLKQSGTLAKATSAVGLGLMTKGLANTEFSRLPELAQQLTGGQGGGNWGNALQSLLGGLGMGEQGGQQQGGQPQGYGPQRGYQNPNSRLQENY